MSVFFTPWWRNKKVKRQTLGGKCWILGGNFFLVLVGFIRRSSLVEHQTNLGYAFYSILPPAVLTCLGGMSRNRKGFPWRQWASDFRVPALMSFFSFWGKSRGTLRLRIYPEGFLRLSWILYWSCRSCVTRFCLLIILLESEVSPGLLHLTIRNSQPRTSCSENYLWLTYSHTCRFLYLPSKKFAQVYIHCTKSESSTKEKKKKYPKPLFAG